MKHLILFLTHFCVLACFSQEKEEYEYRIKTEEVPGISRLWFSEAFGQIKKVKWYAEKSGGDISFEAKFKQNNAKHSVEFDADGIIEDIEIIRDCNELPSLFMENFTDYLNRTYKKYKVFKVQEQWTGSAAELKRAVQLSNTDAITIRYEVEHYGKDEQELEWESLFTKEGTFIKRREIVFTPSTNLLF